MKKILVFIISLFSSAHLLSCGHPGTNLFIEKTGGWGYATSQERDDMANGHVQVVGAVNLAGDLLVNIFCGTPYHCPDDGAAVYLMYHQSFKKLFPDIFGTFYSRMSVNVFGETQAKHSQTLDTVVGYKMLTDNGFFSVNIGFAVPIGKESFFALGAGFDGQTTLCEKKNHTLDLLVAASYRHLFPANVGRTLHLTSGTPIVPALNRHYFYSLDEIIPGDHLDALLGLRYNYKRFVWDIGGNMNVIGGYKFIGRESGYGCDSSEIKCVYTSKNFLSFNAYTGIGFVFKHFFFGVGTLFGTNRIGGHFKLGGSF